MPDIDYAAQVLELDGSPVACHLVFASPAGAVSQGPFGICPVESVRVWRSPAGVFVQFDLAHEECLLLPDCSAGGPVLN